MFLRVFPWLKEWILEGHKDDWKTNVYGQCKSWLDQGLQPRAVTRDLNWGVKVPVEGADGKVLYVWFDAPIGYISATKELTPEWEKYWKDPQTRMIHFIGKDNIVFHCIIFPAMLRAEGTFILPDNVPAFEFLNLEGDKISTSRNWAVWLHEYLLDFPGKQDVLRYVLTSNAPEAKDNDFTWKDFQAKNNNELVAILGNFVNRTMVLTHKFFNGIVPEKGALQDSDREALEGMKNFPGRIAGSLRNFRFRESLSEFMNLARLGNKYLTDNEPWKTFPSDPARTGTILNISLQICAQLSIVGEPFLPFSSEKIRKMLNLPVMAWDESTQLEWLVAGNTLNPPDYVFEKIDDAQIEAQVKRLLDTKKDNESAAAEVAAGFPLKPAKPEITYEDFNRMDIRVATIIEAEKIPKTTKLMKLKVDTGLDQRTLVAGIAEHYTPEQVIGRKICILANLQSRKLKGIESKGMILMAEDAGGQLFFVSTEEGCDNGSTVK